MNKTTSFLGSGWAFPISFGADGRVVLVDDEVDIAQSLFVLLSTRPGERVMQPNFGCHLHDLVFEVVDTRTLGEIREVIEHAILFFEPRIRFERVDINFREPLEGVLDLQIQYSIRRTNTRSNIVYPFYLSEGTDVRL